MWKFKDHNQIMSDNLAELKKYCRCGHSVTVPKSMKKDYKICGWCGGRVYKDDAKQYIHNLQCEREEFRMKIRRIISDIK